MGFNHAPPRTRHRAQCQNDTAISSLTSVFDGRVEYIRSSSTGSSRGCLLLRDLAFLDFYFLFIPLKKGHQSHSDQSPAQRREPSSVRKEKKEKTQRQPRGTRARLGASGKDINPVNKKPFKDD